jgi:hypothetical protein
MGGQGWEGPTGKGIANLIEPGHRDDDIVWIIDLDENGQTWCVPNRFVRAPRNITYGRRSEAAKTIETNISAVPDESHLNDNGQDSHHINGHSR